MRYLLSRLTLPLLITATLLSPPRTNAQLDAGDFLEKGTAGVTDTEVAAGANIATSKLNVAVLIEGDVDTMRRVRMPALTVRSVEL